MGVYGRKNYVFLSRIKALFTRQSFSMQDVYIHCCRASSMKLIHVFTRQSFLKQKANSMFSRDKANLLISCVTF